MNLLEFLEEKQGYVPKFVVVFLAVAIDKTYGSHHRSSGVFDYRDEYWSDPVCSISDQFWLSLVINHRDAVVGKSRSGI